MATAKKTKAASKTTKASTNKTKNVRKNNTGMIVGICCVIVAIIVIIIAAVAISSNSGLNDSYFKSDDSKYVLTIDQDELMISEDEEANYASKKVHIVYEYKDDAITGMKIYYEYADNETAMKALDDIKENQDIESYKELVVDGKYVVATVNESEYEGATVSDVKSQIEAHEALKTMNFDDMTTDETTTTEDTDTTTEDVE